MKKHTQILFLLTINCLNIYGQNITGNLFSANCKKPITDCYILNLNTSIYTYTDSLGTFNISAETGDSLLIQHLAYQPKTITVSDNNIITSLAPKSIDLQEFLVFPNKGKNEVTINFKSKKGFQYGLSYTDEYALRVQNKVKGLLKKLSFPFHFRKKFPNAQKLIVQLYDSNPDTKLPQNPISSHYTLRIDELLQNKELEFTFQEPILVSNNYFIIIKLIGSENTMYSLENNLSLNPFFYISESDCESCLFFKNNNTPGWMNMQKAIGFSAQFHFNLEMITE